MRRRVGVGELVRRRVDRKPYTTGSQLLLKLLFKISNLLTSQQLVTRQRCFIVGSVVPGAGAFEVAVSAALTEFKKTVKGRARLGVQVRSN